MIFKVNKTGAYTVMSNYHLRDKRLTLKSKGLLSVMLSLPDDWDYSIAGLVAISVEKQTAIESALRELQDNGYLFIKKIYPDKSATGKIDYEYNIYEKPATMPLNDDLPENKVNDTPKKKKDDTGALAAKYADTAEMWELIKAWLEIRKLKRLGLTDSAIQLNLKKLPAFAKQAGITEKEYMETVVARGWGAFYPVRDKKPTPETAKPSAKPSYDVEKFKQDALNADLIYHKKGRKE